MSTNQPTEETKPWICPVCKQGAEWGWCSAAVHRKARGLEPEQPKHCEDCDPSFMDCWQDGSKCRKIEQPNAYTLADPAIVAWGNSGLWQRDGFLAGWRANAERQAEREKLISELNRRNIQAADDTRSLVAQTVDLAQRLDLAEAALKRHGFELGVVNDVLAWVPEWPYKRHDDQMNTALGKLAPKGTVLCTILENIWRAKDVDEASKIAVDASIIVAKTGMWAGPTSMEEQNATLKTAAADYAKAAEASAALAWQSAQETIGRMATEYDAAWAELKHHQEVMGVEAKEWKEAVRILHEQRDGALKQLAEWQAVTGKMREALGIALGHKCNLFGFPESLQLVMHEWEPMARTALSAPPPTALLEALEGAWKAGYQTGEMLDDSYDNNPTPNEAWLASETRKRYSGATESVAAEDASGAPPREDRAAPRQVPQTCDYMSPTYGCCQLPVGHEGCHAFNGHKLSKP